MGGRKTSYPDEMVAAIDECLVDGMRFEDIAARIRQDFAGIIAQHGFSITKNAIAGHAFRLRNQLTAKVAAAAAAEAAQIDAAERAIAAGAGVGLLDLRFHHCRWPVADEPEYRFCGRERWEGTSYCAPHWQDSVRSAVRKRL